MTAKRRRARRAFGSISDMGPDLAGRQRWRIRYPLDGRRVTEIVRGTKRDAERRLAQLALEAAPGRQSRVTLSQARERWWLPEARERLAPHTLRMRESAWRLHVAPRWGDVPVAAIKPLDVQEWLLTLTGGQAGNAIKAMRPVLDRAVLYEVIPSNPLAVKYVMPRGRARAGDSGSWDVDGLLAVWGAVRGSPIEAAVILMAFGSCRVGESLGVRASEVEARRDLASPVTLVPISRQVDNSSGKVVESLKNRQSRRTVVVPGPMGVRLRGLASEAVARGDEWLCDDGTGAPVTQPSLKAQWARLLDAADVERHAVRNLRSAWETIARWELRLDPLVIEKLMGHAGGGVTAQHYDRPMTEAMARAVASAYAEHPYAGPAET